MEFAPWLTGRICRTSGVNDNHYALPVITIDLSRFETHNSLYRSCLSILTTVPLSY